MSKKNKKKLGMSTPRPVRPGDAPRPTAAPVATEPAATPPAAGNAARSDRALRRDQQRALTAYRYAAAACDLGEYETAVQNFAAALIRSGFAVAVSVLERSAKRNGYRQLLDHLAAYDLPGLPVGEAAGWPERVRGLADTTLYMQATRELIAFLSWLRRACRAVQGLQKAEPMQAASAAREPAP